MIYLHKPFINENEIRAVNSTMRSKWLSNGPECLKLENKFCKIYHKKYGITFSSWTSAVFCLLKCLNIKKTEEVIVPSLTFIACANVIRSIGAIPVFVDVSQHSVNLSYDDLLKKISSKTRALIAVDQIGYPLENIDKIIQICKKKNIFLIHDIACSVGSKINRKPSGIKSEFLSISLHSRKLVTCGEGGLILTDDKNIKKKLISLKNQGSSSSDFERHNNPKKFQNPKFDIVGYNFRLSDISATIAHSQFLNLNLNINLRKNIANFYFNNLKNVQFPEFSKSVSPNWQSFLIILKSMTARNRLLNKLNSNSVQSKIGMMACHLQKPYVDHQLFLPNTNLIYKNSLLLPIHPYLKKKDLIKIVKLVNEN